MDLLWDTLGFAAKGFIVFLTVAATAGVVFAVARRRRGALPSLEVLPMHQRYQGLADSLRVATLDRKGQKALAQARKQEARAAPKKKPAVYVLDFDGDLLATNVVALREEVTAVAQVAGPDDEVVVRLESPGGAVPHYGLAAAQLARLKERKVKLTVCIDRVAASGGYMMACVADRIVAAPFAIIGSIGVVAQIPNVRKLLEKHDVHVEEMTAGEFKRTITVFGEVTEKGRAKLKEQLEETHALFKDFVKANRPSLDVEKVSTGEYWLARRAAQLGLVDALSTSDDYLMARAKDAFVYQVRFKPAHPWRQRLGQAVADAVDRVLLGVLSRARSLEW
ncbi:MAG: protease SohB [Myxococcota bacterium]|jgi:serine protease SohB